MTDLIKSNSLADLSARVRVEHDAATAAIKKGVCHAMAAGDLLLEAKQLAGHGNFLPWLAQTGLPRRTASHYMRLAANRSTIEAEMGSVAHLTVRGAVELLTLPDQIKPPAPGASADEVWEWAGELMSDDTRFAAFLFEPGSLHLLQSKFASVLRLPNTVQWALALNTFGVCDPEELVEALAKVVPYAKGQEHQVNIDLASDVAALEASIKIKMLSQRIVVLLYDALEAFKKVKDISAHRSAVTARVKRDCEANLAKLSRARQAGEPVRIEDYNLPQKGIA